MAASGSDDKKNMLERFVGLPERYCLSNPDRVPFGREYVVTTLDDAEFYFDDLEKGWALSEEYGLGDVVVADSRDYIFTWDEGNEFYAYFRDTKEKVGMLSLDICPNSGWDVVLQGIYVDSKFQRKGIATALLQCALQVDEVLQIPHAQISGKNDGELYLTEAGDVFIKKCFRRGILKEKNFLFAKCQDGFDLFTLLGGYEQSCDEERDSDLEEAAAGGAGGGAAAIIAQRAARAGERRGREDGDDDREDQGPSQRSRM